MISRYSVKKPFTVLVGVLLVIVLGVVSLGRMTTDLLPDMSFQYALIVTTDTVSYTNLDVYKRQVRCLSQSSIKRARQFQVVWAL